MTFAPACSAACSSRALCLVGGHARLVEDENTSLGQLIAEHLHVYQQSVQSTRRDAGLLGELAGAAAGGRHAEHLIASALVDLAQDAGGVGLARAGKRLDHAHAMPVAEDRAHRGGLLDVQRAVGAVERAVDERGVDDAGPLAGAADRGCDQPSLATDELGGGHLAACRGDDVRALGEALPLRPHLGHERALPGGTRELLQHGVFVEGVGALGQTLGARQQIAEGTLVNTIPHGESVRGTFAARLQQLGHLLRAEPELARACSHLLAPGVRLQAVLLALARGERRPLRGCLRTQPDPARLGLALHLVAACGEVLDHRVLHVGELGRAVVDLAPLKTEALADQRSQVRLVQRPRCLCRRVEQRAVQRGEATVGSAGEVPGDDVGVQLRVERAAHAMPVGGRDQTVGRLDALAAVAAADHHRGVLEIPERRSDGLFVAGDENARSRLRCDREQDAHGLRRAECQVERGDLRIPRRGAQPYAGVSRIESGDQRVELLRLDAPGEPERLGAGADPLPRSLATARVVVIAATRHLLLVVAVLAQRNLADREHNRNQISKKSDV